jgi:peptidoglycan-associated lipoprotein
MGDTGLWYVPTGEVLPRKKWSFSVYRQNFNDNQGFTNVSNFPVTFAAGVSDRAEIFASFVAVTRVDRDIRPVFVSSIPGAGGVVPQNPLMADYWSGSQFGDIWVGAKFNLMSEYQQKPAAFAIRPMIKIPTASKDKGAGTGKVDFAVDAVLSKELMQRSEFSGYVGFIVRGTPAQTEQTNGVRWGVGWGLPSRKSIRFTAELTGEKYTKSSLAIKEILTGTDGSFLPVGFVSDIKSPVDLNLGLTYQHPHNGFFIGAGWTYRLNMDARQNLLSSMQGGIKDESDYVLRLGYHPGVRVYAPPPPTPTPTPQPPTPQNHPPTVRARCEPCTVYVGQRSTVTADASDPDGDPLTYAWSAPAGSITSPSSRSTPWTAPMQEGPVPVTVRVDDGRGGTASDTVTIQVIRQAVREVTFEDVHFDFDRYSLRPEALRTLDEAVRSLQDNPTLRITIEGHTCNIGTAEYNLALGERRANAVRAYLLSRGVSADRMQTVSYGEERPKYDNSREETRRLNRRAALVVRLQ